MTPDEKYEVKRQTAERIQLSDMISQLTDEDKHNIKIKGFILLLSIIQDYMKILSYKPRVSSIV